MQHAQSDYSATIKNFHSDQKHISRLLMTSQILFLVIAVIAALPAIIYYNIYVRKLPEILELDDDKRERRSVLVNLYTEFVLSYAFSFYTFLMSSIALGVSKNDLDENVKCGTERLQVLTRLTRIPPMMLAENLLVLIVFTIIFTIIMPIVKYKLDDDDDFEKTWWWFCAISVIFPIANMSIHANYVFN